MAMSQQERDWLEWLKKVKEGVITQRQAAEKMKVTDRALLTGGDQAVRLRNVNLSGDDDAARIADTLNTIRPTSFRDQAAQCRDLELGA